MGGLLSTLVNVSAFSFIGNLKQKHKHFDKTTTSPNPVQLHTIGGHDMKETVSPTPTEPWWFEAFGDRSEVQERQLLFDLLSSTLALIVQL